MGFSSMISLIYLLIIYSLGCTTNAALDQTDLQTYIVHVESPNIQTLSGSQDIDSWYRSFIPTTTTTTTSSNDELPIVYCYYDVFKGFAAKLSAEEVKEMEKKAGFISARPEKVMSLHTTHSPNFLGLQQNFGFWKASNYGKGMIIGVLDTGILPDHPSFSDEGMPPPPAKWKGKCEFNFTACNNKLIGARYFSSAKGTPLDANGHGTHTASTAAGNFVKGANLFGNANGTASGIAPLAHLAIYKVCADEKCSESDIIAAMDKAIEDGVDVISISLGTGDNTAYYDDSIALGAFSAMKKGIFVSTSAGNSGPSDSTIANEAPWILSVGATTTDRRIRANVVLGNNVELVGESFLQPKNFPLTLLPLVYPGLLNSSQFCNRSSLSKTDVRGKIVLCLQGGRVSRTEKAQAVKGAGGAAMIVMNTKDWANTITPEALNLPVTQISYADGLKIIAFINSTRSPPTARIKFSGTIIGDLHDPAVAAFSSRGPCKVNPGILKPDTVGPGVNILAAWPISMENNTNTKSTFNIISGTSMSCPHLSGVAALLKSSHPNWSAAAIRSAIITTADILNLKKKPIEDETFLPASIFATGAGHVNPSRANDPGLVYDILPEDYVPFLCGLNYTNQQVGMILQREVNCSDSIPQAQLNYPSFSIILGFASQTYTRTITNVGMAKETYSLKVVSPPGVNVSVEPSKLSFTKMNQKLNYQVTIHRLANSPSNVSVQGSILWSSAKHIVRTPIAVILV